MKLPVALAVLTLTALPAAGCRSDPPLVDTTVELRLQALESRSDDPAARASLEKRVHALEDALAKKPSDSPDAGKVAALEARIAVLEERLRPRDDATTEPKAPTSPPVEEHVTVVDRRPGFQTAPAPGEVLRAFAALDGETFSFARGRALDLARLLGVDSPMKPFDAALPENAERRKRQVAAWGEAVFSSEDAWRRARERVEALLLSGELSFEYDPSHDDNREPGERRRVLAYARVKKASGEFFFVNDIMVKEGLALAHDVHARQADMEKLEAEARAAKRGLFAGR
jgi:endonuclease YncB( thermonuclease family)